MKDLNAIVEECKYDIESLGFKVGNIVKVSINTRAKRRWGQCRKTPYGYEINISDRLLKDDVDDMATKNTVAHELLHTIEGGGGHTGAWKIAAERMNLRYGYNIKRCTSSEEKGVENIPSTYSKRSYKYIIKCGNCGLTFKYYKKCKVVGWFLDNPSHAKKYCRCSRCKSHDLELEKNYEAFGYIVF